LRLSLVAGPVGVLEPGLGNAGPLAEEITGTATPSMAGRPFASMGMSNQRPGIPFGRLAAFRNSVTTSVSA